MIDLVAQAAGAREPDALHHGGDELLPVARLHLLDERRRHLRPLRQRRAPVPQVRLGLLTFILKIRHLPAGSCICWISGRGHISHIRMGRVI